MDKSIIIILLIVAIFASLVPVMASQGILPITSFNKILGIPLTSEESTTTVTAPPNVRVVKISQAGQQTVKIFRVKVLSIDTVLNDDGLIKGFNVGLEVKSPGPINVKVIVILSLVDGAFIEVEKIFTLNKGNTVVYVELANPVDPDDVVSIDVNAIPG